MKAFLTLTALLLSGAAMGQYVEPEDAISREIAIFHDLSSEEPTDAVSREVAVFYDLSSNEMTDAISCEVAVFHDLTDYSFTDANSREVAVFHDIITNEFTDANSREVSMYRDSALLIGNVKLQGWSGVTPITNVPLTVIIDGAAQDVEIVSGSGDTGVFYAFLPLTGTHSAAVKPDGFLRQAKSGITPNGMNVSVNFNGPNGAGLLGGDANNDNVIDDFDLFMLTSDFLYAPTPGTFTDVDGSHFVDDFDLFILSSNFLLTGN